MLSVFFTFLCVLQAPVVTAPVATVEFAITHDGAVGESLDGRVYVMLTQGRVPPVSGPNWWNPEPFFAVDVQDWSAGDVLLVDDSADRMKGGPSTLEEGGWKAVAVFRANAERSLLAVHGGLYSDAVEFNMESGAIEVTLALSNEVPDRTWKEHKNLRLVDVPSPMLSTFHGKEILHGGCVIVPDDYDPDREEPYPVMYWIGGFGSDHHGARMMKAYFTASDYDDQICRVILNAQTYSGHHVFADSANNGPRMTALIEEFIPYLEKTYNLGGSGEKRFLAGHSSGGWSSMWLQVQNPDFFNGVWSLAPDPLDFHYFQTPDLYAENANMYTDENGEERPLGRRGITPVLFSRGFIAMDDVIKDGGQIGSFEWVFSPKGEDGRPAQMFDRETGAVNPEVVEYWKQYDIRKILEDNWDELSPKLAGKINIIAGGIDTFYLEQPVIEMKKMFEEKEFDAMVRVMENGDHGAVFRTTVIREIDDFIAEKLSLPNIQNKKTQSK
jgi:hypothetical protein